MVSKTLRKSYHQRFTYKLVLSPEIAAPSAKTQCLLGRNAIGKLPCQGFPNTILRFSLNSRAQRRMFCIFRARALGKPRKIVSFRYQANLGGNCPLPPPSAPPLPSLPSVHHHKPTEVRLSPVPRLFYALYGHLDAKKCTKIGECTESKPDANCPKKGCHFAVIWRHSGKLSSTTGHNRDSNANELR